MSEWVVLSNQQLSCALAGPNGRICLQGGRMPFCYVVSKLGSALIALPSITAKCLLNIKGLMAAMPDNTTLGQSIGNQSDLGSAKALPCPRCRVSVDELTVGIGPQD